MYDLSEYSRHHLPSTITITVIPDNSLEYAETQSYVFSRDNTLGDVARKIIIQDEYDCSPSDLSFTINEINYYMSNYNSESILLRSIFYGNVGRIYVSRADHSFYEPPGDDSVDESKQKIVLDQEVIKEDGLKFIKAIVIGINNYKRMRQLSNCINDT